MASGIRTVRIRFDGSASGLTGAAAKARAELKALQRQADDNKKSLTNFSSGVGDVATRLALVASSISNMSTGVAVVMALTSTMLALSGAAGLLPAAILGGVASLAVLKLGADGIKAAFAQLNPTLDGLKAKVSASFQQSLLPAVNDLKVALPQLSGGFQGIASAMGGVLAKITAWLRTPAAIQQINTILSGTGQIIKNVGAAFAPLIAAFVRIGAVAMPILVQLTSGFGDAATRFNDWVQRMADSGAITQWIQNAIETFRGLWSILKDVGSIVVAVFGAIQDAGVGLGGLGGLLVPVINAVKEFVQSADGHDTIVALAQAVQQVGSVVTSVLLAALRAVAPVLPPLLSAFSQLAQQVASVLVPAIQALSPILAGLATFLAQNMAWLGPILIAVGAFAAAIWAVNAAIAAWEVITGIMTAVQWLLNAALDANPIGIVILAIGALIAIIVLIVTHLDFFRGIWDSVWKFCSDIITGVWNWIQANWPLLLSILTGPIGAAVAFIITHWQQIQNVVGGIIGWFQSAWSSAVSAVGGFFGGLASRVSGAFDAVAGAVRSSINAVIRLVNGAIGGVNKVTGLVGIPGIPNIPYLARGGTAVGGRSYLVGERGPELFTPGRTGRVTNAQTTADAIGSGGGQPVTINLDLGDGIRHVVQTTLDENNSATLRALGMGVGRSR
jgi:phage-related protein